MKFLAVCTILLTFSFSALANWCDRSYRHENFWISAASSFGESVSKNIFVDEMCWRLGKQYGAKIVSNNNRNSKACTEAFRLGKEDGLKAITQNNDFPVECYNAGMRYGISTLISNARIGKDTVSSSGCVKSYQSGLKDGKADIVAQPGMEKVEYVCYMGGFQDGALFRGLL